jgi:predicted transcriptional regulator
MNSSYNRTFIASSELFSGFKVEINIQSIDTVDNIIKIFTDELKTVLKKYNFEILLESVNVKKFHVHSHTLEQILISNKDEIIYICDHC